MWKPGRSAAEQKFAAAQKQDKKLLKQKEKREQERDERMARLRALRLGKEAAGSGSDETDGEAPGKKED